jgi:hypothetical protein
VTTPVGWGSHNGEVSGVLMYKGLYNPYDALSSEDFHAVGLLTAQLLLFWSSWTHRRVERIKFVDEDAISRDVSVDFTVPHWFHRVRGTQQTGRKRQLVPLGLLRKGTLMSFSLHSDSNHSLPLLTTPQNIEVAEATLVALAGQVIEHDVPERVRQDIRTVVEGDPSESEANLQRLFERRDKHSDERGMLRKSAVFRSLAIPLAENFLALTMVAIGWHERRVLHYCYDEPLWVNRTGLRDFIAPAVGGSRDVIITVPASSHADSYHVEVEAPDGLQIATREGYTEYPGGTGPIESVEKTGSHQRSHIHFKQAELGAEALVLTHLFPRPSAIIRSSCFAGTLAFLTIVFFRLRLSALTGPHSGDQKAAAAAVLLGFQAVVSLYLARSDQNAMTTNLLWPVRLVASIPGTAALVSAAAIVAGSSGTATEAVLWGMAGLTGASTALLAVAWRRLNRRARHYW